MTPSLQIRASGVVLAISGVLLGAGYFLYPSTAADPNLGTAAWLVFMGAVGVIATLPIFQAAQATRAGLLGWLGTALTVLSIALLELPHSVLGFAYPAALNDLDRFHSSIAGLAEFASQPLLAVGVILLTIATWRAHVHPRWTAWALIAILIVSVLCLLLDPLATALHFPAEDYLLMATLGIAMATSRRRAVPAQAERADESALV